jgi:nucleotide-binding universal stress UspA family protein
MYRKIVVGVDAREQAGDALALAALLRANDGVVIAASVYRASGHGRGHERESALAQAAEETLARAGGQIDASWLSLRAVRGHSPAHGLHVLSEEVEADLVVVGSSHRSDVGRVLAGSTGERLLNGSPCPVAVVPRGFASHARAPRLIGVPFDGSEEASTALREGAALAGALGAALELVSVVPPISAFSVDPYSEVDVEIEHYRREELRRALEEAAATLPDELRATTALRDGQPADEIVEAAGDDTDLLVLGSRNYGPLRRVMVGSTAIELMRRSPCPVLVIPRGAEAAAR